MGQFQNNFDRDDILSDKNQNFSSNSLNNNNLSCLSPRIPSPSVFLRTAWFPARLPESNHPVVCRAIFSRKRNPQLPPTSLGPAALHPRHLKRSTEWRPTLNSEMNSPKTLHHEENHSRHQLTL